MTDNKYPELPDFEAVEQHIYEACRRFVARDMLEPIHNLIRDGIDADRAMRAGTPAVSQGDALRSDLITTLHEVFYTKGPETPQTVRDVIEYADSWLQVYIQKRAERSSTQPQEAAPYVAGPKIRAKMEEWLKEGTLIDRVAEVLTQQENEIIRLEKLVKEQPAPSQDAEDENPTRPASEADMAVYRSIRENYYSSRTGPDQDAEAINAELLRCLEDCVEDSEECLQRHLDSYGEAYKPQRVAAMRKCISDAKAAIDAARAQKEKK